MTEIEPMLGQRRSIYMRMRNRGNREIWTYNGKDDRFDVGLVEKVHGDSSVHNALRYTIPRLQSKGDKLKDSS